MQLIGIILASALVGWFLPWKILLLLTAFIVIPFSFWLYGTRNSAEGLGPALVFPLVILTVVPAWILKGIRVIDANTWSSWLNWWMH